MPLTVECMWQNNYRSIFGKVDRSAGLLLSEMVIAAFLDRLKGRPTWVIIVISIGSCKTKL
jgi:hypothetical protein